MDVSDESTSIGYGHHSSESETAAHLSEIESGHRLDSCDELAKAISSTLGSVMEEFNSRADSVFGSQDALLKSIDRLTTELDKLLEDAPLPFILQHSTKISSLRKRVSSLNLVLKSIQRRIDNIDRMLSTGLPKAVETTPSDIVAASSFTL